MNKKQCKDALDFYKKFLVRMDRVAEFLKVAENVGIDKGDIPDLTRVNYFEKRTTKRDTRYTLTALRPQFQNYNNDKKKINKKLNYQNSNAQLSLAGTKQFIRSSGGSPSYS